MPRPWEIHPSLVHFPIALLVAAVALDLYALVGGSVSFFRYATGLLVAGALTMVVAGAAGLLAFYTVPAHTEEDHALMLWHLGLNLVGLVLWSGLAFLRWRGRAALPERSIVAVGVLVLAMTLFASYLGGDLVYRHGVGVEPRALREAVEH
jgi:uncharacterized membrane protein